MTVGHGGVFFGKTYDWRSWGKGMTVGHGVQVFAAGGKWELLFQDAMLESNMGMASCLPVWAAAGESLLNVCH